MKKNMILLDEIIKQIQDNITISICIDKLSDEIDHLRTGFAQLINSHAENGGLKPRDLEALTVIQSKILKLSQARSEYISVRYRRL